MLDAVCLTEMNLLKSIFALAGVDNKNVTRWIYDSSVSDSPTKWVRYAKEVTIHSVLYIT